MNSDHAEKASPENDAAEIIPADAKQRRQVLVVSAMLLLLGMASLAALKHYLGGLEDLARNDIGVAIERTRRVTMVATIAFGTSLAGLGAWLWVLGRKINRSGQFPPPGTKVIRDTPIRTGPRAQAMANIAQAGAFSCIVAGTVGAWYMYGRILALLQP